MRIIVTRAFSINGERQEVGATHDLDAKFAAELIHNNKAVVAPSLEEKPAKKTAAKEKSSEPI